MLLQLCALLLFHVGIVAAESGHMATALAPVGFFASIGLPWLFDDWVING